MVANSKHYMQGISYHTHTYIWSHCQHFPLNISLSYSTSFVHQRSPLFIETQRKCSPNRLGLKDQHGWWTAWETYRSWFVSCKELMAQREKKHLNWQPMNIIFVLGFWVESQLFYSICFFSVFFLNLLNCRKKKKFGNKMAFEVLLWILYAFFL